MDDHQQDSGRHTCSADSTIWGTVETSTRNYLLAFWPSRYLRRETAALMALYKRELLTTVLLYFALVYKNNYCRAAVTVRVCSMRKVHTLKNTIKPVTYAAYFILLLFRFYSLVRAIIYDSTACSMRLALTQLSGSTLPIILCNSFTATFAQYISPQVGALPRFAF